MKAIFQASTVLILNYQQTSTPVMCDKRYKGIQTE